VSENRALRKLFGSKREEVETGGDCIMRSFMICTAHIIVGDKTGEDTMGWACVLYKGEKYTRFWQET